MTIKCDGIILDVDGTILNTTYIAAESYNKAIVASGYPVEPNITGEILQREFGKTMSIIANNLWPNLTSEQQMKLMHDSCDILEKMLQENEKDITYKGVIDTIKSFSKEIDFYIVSNCQNGYIELITQKSGLDKYIKDFECYGRTGKDKATNLRMLVERNHLQNPVYVGDTQGDADACAKAEIPFIWAAYGFGQNVPCLKRIDSFPEIVSLLHK